MSLNTPYEVQHQLEAIESEMAHVQNELERVTIAWFGLKRRREIRFAEENLKADGAADQRKSKALLAVAQAETGADGEVEGKWEALKAKQRILGDRANACMAILKAQARA